MRDRGGRPRLAALGVVTGYGLVASVFTTIVAVRLRGMDDMGVGLRLSCVLGTVGLLVLGAAAAAGIRWAMRRRGH
ncbi:MAG: hypothetical protein QOE54_2285 [Streptosporangiaceae bacterium]|nr:hypothetical protein [Streptosporangiaceae bacterium]MDX6429919.1 hypothetical protein [Streptosporangiaceae bacterium]